MTAAAWTRRGDRIMVHKKALVPRTGTRGINHGKGKHADYRQRLRRCRDGLPAGGKRGQGGGAGTRTALAAGGLPQRQPARLVVGRRSAGAAERLAGFPLFRRHERGAGRGGRRRLADLRQCQRGAAAGGVRARLAGGDPLRHPARAFPGQRRNAQCADPAGPSMDSAYPPDARSRRQARPAAPLSRGAPGDQLRSGLARRPGQRLQLCAQQDLDQRPGAQAGHLRALRQLRPGLPGAGQEHPGPQLSGAGRAKGRGDPPAAPRALDPAAAGRRLRGRRQRPGRPRLAADPRRQGDRRRRQCRLHRVAAALPRSVQDAAQAEPGAGAGLDQQRRLFHPGVLSRPRSGAEPGTDDYLRH